MGRQLNVRSDRAVELATQLAARRGTAVARVVEEALEALARADDAEDERRLAEKRARWRALLEEGWKQLNNSDFTLDDLYDPETGLPA